MISSCSDDDRALIKSALTQLSLIMQDHTLHIVFLDNHGLDMVIKLLFASTVCDLKFINFLEVALKVANTFFLFILSNTENEIHISVL